MRFTDLFKPYFSVANLLLLTSLIYMMFVFDWSGSTVAAWVQAVGSVAAILVASEIASRQGREQAEMSNNKNLVIFDGLGQLAQRAVRVGDGLHTSTITGTLEMSLSLYSGLKRNFDSIDILALPVPELVDPVCTIRDSLQRLERDVSFAVATGIQEKYLLERRYAIDVALIIWAKGQIVEARAHYQGCTGDSIPSSLRFKEIVKNLLAKTDEDQGVK
ncbi:hypothetical protein [Pseudomonas sp. Irchel 3E19]|uniref:hypothetical protein n=1 Tax=Pseudomonas sp. Irchel 3E19 TaxID=2008981 RepID=UPI000BA4730D|nr:hypothetical protein [Pseudomonas sp. Irchel 3E19]